MKTLTASLVAVALAAASLVAGPIASASAWQTSIYGTLQNHTAALLTRSASKGLLWNDKMEPRTLSHFTFALWESGFATYRITEDGRQTGTVTVRVNGDGGGFITTCVASGPYVCEMTETIGFPVATLRGNGSPRFVYNAESPSTWNTLRLACDDLTEPKVSCAQRQDLELEARLAGTVYYLDRVRWSELPAAMAGQPYSAALTNPLQHLHRTEVSGLPDGLRYDDALHRVVGTPAAAGGRWITLTLMDGDVSLSSRTAWFVVNDERLSIKPGQGLTPAKVGQSYLRYIAATVPKVGTAAAGETVWSVTGLPAGMSSVRLGYDQRYVQIYGVPTVSGTFPVTVTVSNLLGSSSQTYQLTVQK